MRLLLDTHIAIWAIVGAPELPAKAAEMLEDRDNEIWISSIVPWEIAIKHRNGKFPHSANQMCHGFQVADFKILDVKESHVRMLDGIPLESMHKDPFGRMMVAQAKAEGMVLLTHDSKMVLYQPVALVV